MTKPVIILVGSAMMVSTLGGVALSQPDFYAGKTVLMVIATDPGGSGDLRTKAILPALRKHLPGNPSIVVQYMPGAGGQKAANHVYKAVRPDGLTIGAMLTGMVQGAILGEPGVLYDIDKMIYLGSHARYAPYALLSRKGAGLSSKDKLKSVSGIRIGAPSVGHTLYATARLFAYIMDMKEPRFVTGYTPRELDFAIDRGEIDARVNIVDSTIQRNPHWFEKDLIDLHATLDIPKGISHAHPRFAKLPELETFAKSKREERLIELLRSLRGTGQPFVVPPGTPGDRVDILKEATRKALRDPEYAKAYEKLTTEPAMPLLPEEYEKALREIPREPELIDLIKKLSGPGPLPLR
jgi:tripartite-type tricarboxylate transporter receptor subunit TctC